MRRLIRLAIAVAVVLGLGMGTGFIDPHNPTDTVFSEVHLVSCRNVLIYFDGTLQDRAVGLFAEALARGGFLGLGSHETLRFSTHAASFAAFAEPDRIWRRNADQETIHAR